MATRKNVPAARVRAWFKEAQPEGVPTPGSRGRLHPETIEAFHKANPRERYETGKAEAPTVQVPTFDKKGRKTGRTKAVPTREVRALLGQEGGKGRFSADALVQAGRAMAGLSPEA